MEPQKKFEGWLLSPRLIHLVSSFKHAPGFANFASEKQTLKEIGEKLEGAENTVELEAIKKIYFEILFELDETKSDEVLEQSIESILSETLAAPTQAATPVEELWANKDFPMDSITEKKNTEEPVKPLISIATEEVTLPHIQVREEREESLWGAEGFISKKEKKFHSPLTQEMDELGTFLNSQEEYLKGSPLLGHFQKIIFQVNCNLVESEAKAVLAPYLKSLFPMKAELASRILNKTGKIPTLDPDFRSSVEKLSSKFAEGKISYTGILNSIRYFSTVNESDPRFTLYDHGVLILTFGHQEKVDKFVFENRLHLPNCTDEESLQLAFCFLQLQRLKTKISSLETVPDNTTLEQINTLKRKILERLQKISP